MLSRKHRSMYDPANGRDAGLFVDSFLVSLKSIRIAGGEAASGLTISQRKASKEFKYTVTRDAEGLVEYVQVMLDQIAPNHRLAYMLRIQKRRDSLSIY